MEVFQDASKAHKGKMVFAYSGVKDRVQERLAKYMGVTEADLPVLTVMIGAGMQSFWSPVKVADHTVESIGTFLDDVLNGKVERHLKSQTPVDNSQNEVYTVVGADFDAIVRDPTKDVLVQFHSPSNAHCKTLAPIWNELGSFYKDHPDLIIAKFDATINEAEGVEILGYPTLMFYSKENKQGIPLHYKDERQLQNIKDWLAEHSSVLKSAQQIEDDEL